jgi:multiple sugar transport system substrate-binding protein
MNARPWEAAVKPELVRKSSLASDAGLNPRRRNQMNSSRPMVSLAAIALALGASLAAVAVRAADPVADRAVDLAKAYMKAHKIDKLEQTMLLNSLFRNAIVDFTDRWEKLTNIKIVSSPLGYTDIPSKIMAEAVAKTGSFDIFNDFPYTMPDAVGAGVIMDLDKFAAKGKPDFNDIEPGLKFQQYYNGKLYNIVLDGDQLVLALRKDIIENPQVIKEYQAKFGKKPGCPATVDEWEQMAAYFQTKAGETRWGIKFDKPMYGAMGYRSVNFSYRHFPVYFGGLLFDKDMKPQINTPEGITAIKKFTSIVKYMPPDIQGWGTPQIYGLWGSAQAFSAMSFPSIVGFGNSNPKSEVKGKQISCLIPTTTWKGKQVRRDPQAAGTGYMVNTYSKHPELAYYFIQWLTSPSIGAEAIAHPKGFWDPYRRSNLQDAAILKRYGQQHVETTLENTKYTVSLLMIEGNYEYFKILDNNLADVMSGNLKPEEAAKKIEEGWNRVTEDIGRDRQIKAWRAGVETGMYGATFKDM